jgi:hypothetical protein
VFGVWDWGGGASSGVSGHYFFRNSEGAVVTLSSERHVEMYATSVNLSYVVELIALAFSQFLISL